MIFSGRAGPATALLLAPLFIGSAINSNAQAAAAITDSMENKPAVDRLLRRAADILTDMSGPVGRVYFPVATTNPNAGTTYGFLPVWLLTNEQHQIKHIFAPMSTYNPTLGPAFSGTYYYYPTDRSNFRVILDKAAKSNYRGSVRHENLGFLDGRCVLKFNTNYEADGSSRFFGIGPASPRQGEASYRLIEKLAQTELGIKYWGSWQITTGWQYRYTKVLPGPFKTSGTLDPFVQTITTFSNPKLTLLRDTRDFPATPGQGSLTELFAEFSDTAFGSAAAYRHYGGQWRLYAPQTQTLTAALHAQTEWSQGTDIPFTALASLGGPRSLRGFPEGRFQDRGSLFVNLEERWAIHRLDVVNALTEFQIAPFLDMGTVFHDAGGIQAKYLQAVPGLAFRAVVKPTVVGRVEVGIGKEGPTVFVGIDYPL